MSSRGPALQFVLYSEDAARDALETMAHLLRGMLKHVCPGVKMQHVLIRPIEYRAARVHGSYWKERSRKPKPADQELRKQLLRSVATELALGRVVFFHVDADAIWRTDATPEQRCRSCENLGTHWPRFRRDVMVELSGLRSRASVKTCEELEQVLILAMPFYEIESWAFANTRRLRELLNGERDLATLARWKADLAALDEIADIKGELTIEGTRNVELVQTKHGFPLRELDEVGKSFSATLARLRVSEVVRRGLEEAAAQPF